MQFHKHEQWNKPQTQKKHNTGKKKKHTLAEIFPIDNYYFHQALWIHNKKRIYLTSFKS